MVLEAKRVDPEADLSSIASNWLKSSLDPFIRADLGEVLGRINRACCRMKHFTCGGDERQPQQQQRSIQLRQEDAAYFYV